MGRRKGRSKARKNAAKRPPKAGLRQFVREERLAILSVLLMILVIAIAFLYRFEVIPHGHPHR